MDIHLTKDHFNDLKALESSCFLTTNHLGGYCSMTLAQSLTRQEHSFFTGALIAPNALIHYVKQLSIAIIIDGCYHQLSSQYFNHAIEDGFNYFISYQQSPLPQWTYQIGDIKVIQQVVMVHRHNRIGVQFKITNPKKQSVELIVTPRYSFTLKDQHQALPKAWLLDHQTIQADQYHLYYRHNGKTHEEYDLLPDFHFEYDARDGRPCLGEAKILHHLHYECTQMQTDAYLIYETSLSDQSIHSMIDDEIKRLKQVVAQSQCQQPFTKQLVLAAQHFMSDKDYPKGETIIAGYPFFSDWGRDTMIALDGCCLATHQYETAKTILSTFIHYQKDGLIPNVFNDLDPRYNSIDAPLLLINAIYHYEQSTHDLGFIYEALPTIQSIIHHYYHGTHYHIKMADNYLVKGGQDDDQLTWMDVNFEGILPTPRQGFAIEINALWYNAIRIYELFLTKCNQKDPLIDGLGDQVKDALTTHFFNQDVIHDYFEEDEPNTQIRPNMAYAIGLPFTAVNEDQANLIIQTIEQHLYTPLGLRTLHPEDDAFKPIYIGSHYERDMAYHQGTVWPYLMGQYWRGVLRFQPTIAKAKIQKQMAHFEQAMMEGCVGQIAEIYDGMNPHVSRGCYAQAWSVAEILAVAKLLEVDACLPIK